MHKISTRSFYFTLILMMLISGMAIAQSKSGSIKGIIKSSDGQIASFVNVGLKEIPKSTISGEDGQFLLKNVPAGNYTLKVSFVGSKVQEQKINVLAGQVLKIDFTLKESADQLNEVQISGYTTGKRPVTIGKSNIKPMDLPQSVQVIGAQVIADQQINRLSDALKNANGVAVGASRGSTSDNFYARGYSLGANNILKNGARVNTGAMPEASTLESVEILKGSAALLYGGVSGGAVVNMVTKKPQFEYGGEVSMRAGSYDFYKPTIDLYGPINKNLAFRVIGTYENAGSFRDNVKSNRFYVNPSLLYKIGNKTEILFQADYLNTDFTPDFGFGTVGNVIQENTPRSKFINTPWAYNKVKQTSAQVNVNHKFNENWKLTALATLGNFKRDYFSTERPAAIANGDWYRSLTRSRTNENSYNEQVNLTGSFYTGSIKHDVLIGADADQTNLLTYGYNNPNDKFFKGTNPNPNTPFYDVINLLDPNKFIARTDIPDTYVIAETKAPVYRMGTFVQDLITITDKFKVLAGIRWSYQNSPRTSIDSTLVNKQSRGAAIQKDKAFSPKFALIYQPVKSTSVYVSYSSSFVPNTGTDIYGSALPASTLDQYEAGVKNDFLDGRLSASVTAYRIINNKTAQTAPAKLGGAPNSNTDSNIKEITGKTASDGVEIDLTGKIVDGLSFLAGYSYNFMRYTKTVADIGLVEGRRLVGTIKNTANGTVFYTFNEGQLKGLKLGTSVFYVGARNGGRDDNKTASKSTGTIPLKPFTTVDFSAGYSFSQFSILAKLSNIGNTYNYYVHENYSINPIPPRQFMTTLSYKF
ncbi:TonB-dependent receptor [Pedobacter sp. PAMC26386]|nr:TonB-dependent receptor [Pedobacter sp. PAMC26386]